MEYQWFQDLVELHVILSASVGCQPWKISGRVDKWQLIDPYRLTGVILPGLLGSLWPKVGIPIKQQIKKKDQRFEFISV
jgi:hypothetical protein